MRYAYVLFCLLLFSSCEQFDDPIPEGATLEYPVLTSRIVNPSEVLLTWSSVQICAGFCPSTVPASSYEVWAQSPTSSISYKLTELPAGEMSYTVSGLEAGEVQEFYVLAKRADVRHQTNRVMVVPDELPEAQLVFAKAEHRYITHPQVSPDGLEVAFSVSASGAADRSQDLFVYNLQTGTETMLVGNGQFPAWSAAGDQLAFVSAEPNASIVNRIELGTQEVEPVMESSYQSYFPLFVEEDASMVFLLDSLDEGDRGMQLMGLSEEDTAFLHEVEYIEILGPPILGMDYAAETDMVTYGRAVATDSGDAWDIVGFDMSSPSATVDLLVSDWQDSHPSISRENPELMAFVSDRSGIGQVWVVSLASGRLIQVTNFGESEWINAGIVRLSWSGEMLYVNVQEVPDTTKLLRFDISALLEE